MKLLITIVGFIFALAFGAANAGDRATRDEAMAMLKKAQAYAKANGKEKAIAVFNDPNGEFVAGDMYVVVTDLTGKVLAHGGNPRLVGKELIDMKDPDGKSFVREQIEVVKTKGSGSVSFKFVNPVSKEIERRVTFVEGMGDYYLTTGIFLK